MGEAKRRRDAVVNGVCPCGSAKPARTCCFNGRDWHKPPAVLGLKDLPPASKVERCYMRELGSCVAPISGEHLISESVIEILRAEGDFSISGLPWQEAGEPKILAPQSLRANCLCVKHNSTLHPLDDAALYFFASLRSYLEQKTGFRHALISGHDLERWLLKTAKLLGRHGVAPCCAVLVNGFREPPHGICYSVPLASLIASVKPLILSAKPPTASSLKGSLAAPGLLPPWLPLLCDSFRRAHKTGGADRGQKRISGFSVLGRQPPEVIGDQCGGAGEQLPRLPSLYRRYVYLVHCQCVGGGPSSSSADLSVFQVAAGNDERFGAGDNFA
jgi:hypothetical protein